MTERAKPEHVKVRRKRVTEDPNQSSLVIPERPPRVGIDITPTTPLPSLNYPIT